MNDTSLQLGQPSAIPRSPRSAPRPGAESSPRHRLRRPLHGAGNSPHSVPSRASPISRSSSSTSFPAHGSQIEKPQALPQQLPRPRRLPRGLYVAIGKRLAELLEPRYLRIGGYWYPRRHLDRRVLADRRSAGGPGRGALPGALSGARRGESGRPTPRIRSAASAMVGSRPTERRPHPISTTPSACPTKNRRGSRPRRRDSRGRLGDRRLE